jgi:aryl-alcohol dehydrogenase-like predicted oxidoreductase
VPAASENALTAAVRVAGAGRRYRAAVAPPMPRRSLGASGFDVSALALGSWRTFERISRDAGVEVMRAARDSGINLLDDARYNDETGTAPIPTGYSEVIFGELFRRAGWPRDDTIVCNKLWWEFWPEQDAAAELDGSLQRMQFEYVDVIYANPPPDGLGLEEMVDAVAGLIRAGKARSWAIVNWEPAPLAEVARLAREQVVPPPCAAQLPYSLVHRSSVEDPAMGDALAACGAPVVASYVLAGGVLTGKYRVEPDAGRAAGTLDQPGVAAAVGAGDELVAYARELDVSPASLAVAFALLNPAVATVLFGATRPAQLRDNVAALGVVEQLDAVQRTRLARIGLPALR